jgi:hypothetical protein
MDCYDCQGRPGPGGLQFSDRSAIGICHGCGKGLCKEHSVWTEATRELLCTACASAQNGQR